MEFSKSPVLARIFTWPGAPAKVRSPNGKWMYFIGEDTVSKPTYKEAVGKACAAPVDARAPSTPQQTSVKAAPTRMTLWKNGDAGFWVNDKRATLDEFVAAHLPTYKPGEPFTKGGNVFRVEHVAEKYSVYYMNGFSTLKKTFLSALALAMTADYKEMDCESPPALE